MKPTDQAIFGMVSESPGRNASEPSGGLDKKMNPEAEPSPYGRRQHDRPRADRGGLPLRRGGSGQHGDKGMSSNWRNRPRPIEQLVEQVSRITGNPGKSTEDETAAARLGVATKRGNARGARGPCCIRCLGQREAGVR